MKRAVIPVIAVALAVCAAAAVILIPKPGYAKEGRMVRARYTAYLNRASSGEADDSSGDGGEPELPFYFHVPDGFLETKMGDKEFVTPINPFDTPEIWLELDGAEERHDASQLAKEIVDTASTRELLLYCMNYNFDIDVFMFDSLQDGIDMVKESFNGLRELFSREDASEALVELYRLYDPAEQYASDEFSTVRFHYLEALLSSAEVLNSLTKDEASVLAASCAEKLTWIMETEDCPYSMDTTVYLAVLSQYMCNKDFAEIADSSQGVLDYLASGRLVLDDIDDETLGKLYLSAAEFIKVNGEEEQGE